MTGAHAGAQGRPLQGLHAAQRAQVPPSKAGDVERALRVLVTTPAIAAWLAQHDPQALKQAREALDPPAECACCGSTSHRSHLCPNAPAWQRARYLPDV